MALDRAAAKYEERIERQLARTGAGVATIIGEPGTAPSSATGTSTTQQAASSPTPEAGEDAAQTVTGRKVHKYAQSAGPRNQPKKTPRKQRGQ